MSFYMATTSIAAEKTAMEISSVLAKHGASQIMTEYNEGVACGLSFCITKNGHPISFKLPVRADKVLISMKADRKTPRHLCSQEQAGRVAWRLILRWVEAQLALVEVDAVELVEVFLPYAHTRNGITLYEQIQSNGFNLLPERAS